MILKAKEKSNPLKCLFIFIGQFLQFVLQLQVIFYKIKFHLPNGKTIIYNYNNSYDLKINLTVTNITFCFIRQEETEYQSQQLKFTQLG